MNAKQSSGHKLKLFVQGDREIVITRVFDAPRNLVFDAWTKPELLKRWLGVRNGWSLAECEVDLRVGGAWRFVWRSAKREMTARGVYRDVAAPERIVNTEVFDDPWYPGECVNTTVFEEQGGRTTVTSTGRYESQAARDGVASSPMARGVEESYEALDELLGARAA